MTDKEKAKALKMTARLFCVMHGVRRFLSGSTFAERQAMKAEK